MIGKEMTDKEMMEHLLNGKAISISEITGFYLKLDNNGNLGTYLKSNNSYYGTADIPDGCDVEIYTPIIKRELSWAEIEDALLDFMGNEVSLDEIIRDLPKKLGF